ncbi:MAG: glutamate--tRNA ligase [Candidatus Aenigmarchaeota archaeon]|nr:glutamate--tRNA ligase [Candidatus Aenigmarchaeota archaeon]
MNFKDEIKKLVLANAGQHGGKAQASAIISQAMAKMPEARGNPKETIALIDETVNLINKMPMKEQLLEIKKLGLSVVVKKVVRRVGLPELKNAEKGKVVMRFEPSPSGALHVGHAFVVILNSEYVKKYGGKFYLRFSDTNPDNICVDAYKMIPEDVRWITGSDFEIVLQSDRLEKYYDYGEEAIKKGHAYVCTCEPEKFREHVNAKKACPCRGLSPDENKNRWKKMFNTYKQGEAVVRMKTDITHKNPAIRDWPAFRINDTPHPRTGRKYRVWPLMNFAVPVDDHDFGMTHIIRGKDHITNTERQKYLYSAFAWKIPEFIHIGRINFTGLKLSTTQTRKAIDEGKYMGWDDIRLPFLRAFKKRGYRSEAFRKFVTLVGTSAADKTVSFEDFMKTINSYNKTIIDPIAPRYFFVPKPTKIKVVGIKKTKIDAPKHPDNKNMGVRELISTDELFISKEDAEKLKKGSVIRLKYGTNIRFKTKNNAEISSNDAVKGVPIIQWVSTTANVPVKMILPSGKKLVGFSEPDIKDIKDSVVQFERVGFARVIKEGKDIVAYGLHK